MSITIDDCGNQIIVKMHIITNKKDADELVKSIRMAARRMWPAPRETYKVVFMACGEKKIEAIKTIRAHLGMALKDAKDATEKQEPYIISTHSTHREAAAFVADLLSIGATAQIL